MTKRLPGWRGPGFGPRSPTTGRRRRSNTRDRRVAGAGLSAGLGLSDRRVYSAAVTVLGGELAVPCNPQPALAGPMLAFGPHGPGRAGRGASKAGSRATPTCELR